MSMLKEEEHAVCSLKPGKAPGSDNITAEFLKHGEEETIKILPWCARELGVQGMARRMDMVEKIPPVSSHCQNKRTKMEPE